MVLHITPLRKIRIRLLPRIHCSICVFKGYDRIFDCSVWLGCQVDSCLRMDPVRINVSD